jgi:hypothetical protein
MLTDQTSPEDFVNARQGDYSHIKGWGIDANIKNDPTYPIKNRNNSEHEGYSWERPALQDKTVEILKSVERPNLTAVYGTSKPPTGLSGIIRRIAYKFSESSYGRWIPLILADRIDMVEGVIDDLSKGHIPNVPKEIGLKSEWKHNKEEFLIKTAAGILITGAVLMLLFSSSDKKPKKSEL